MVPLWWTGHQLQFSQWPFLMSVVWLQHDPPSVGPWAGIWAASSFCCHSEEAETEAWLEASGAWKQRMWENGSWEPTLPQCPFSPQLPRGLLLFSFTKLGPCQGSGPHNLPRLCGCSRRGLRVAWGWRIRVECLGTRKGETRGFIPLAGTYYQWGGAREFTISACGSLNGH